MQHLNLPLKSLSLAALLGVLAVSKAAAQEFYRPVDTLDRNFVFAGIASSILPKDKIEIFGYALLNSFWLAVHETGPDSPVRDRLRSTRFVGNLEGYYGISNTRRFDLGVRLQYTRSRLDNEARSPVSRVFRRQSNEEENMDIDKTYAGVTGFGLRVKAMPIGTAPALTVNAGYTIATVKSAEDQRNLFAERDLVDLAVTYYLSLNDNAFYYFVATGGAYLPSATNDQPLYTAGGNFFLTHLLFQQRWVLYPGLSYNIAFKPPDQGDKALVRTGEQLIALLGLQFQPGEVFSINVSAGLPLILNSSDLFVEQVRESYTYLSLGFRVVI